MTWRFPLLSFVLCKSLPISAFEPSSSLSYSLVMLFIHLAFSLYFFLGGVAILQYKIVRFLLHPAAIVCFRVISSQLLIEFSFVVFERPALSVLFYSCRYLFNFPSFASTFWFISSCCSVIFSCAACSFLLLHISASFFCLIILACLL